MSEYRWNTEPYETMQRLYEEREKNPVYYLKKSQIDNIREVLQSFAEVIRSFEEQLDLVEANQQMKGTESD